MRVKSYNATFVKKTGEERTMNFVRIGDLPDAFLVGKVNNTGYEPDPHNGLELVWDLDNKGFRTFNNNTTVGKVTSREVDIG